MEKDSAGSLLSPFNYKRSSPALSHWKCCLHPATPRVNSLSPFIIGQHFPQQGHIGLVASGEVKVGPEDSAYCPRQASASSSVRAEPGRLLASNRDEQAISAGPKGPRGSDYS